MSQNASVRALADAVMMVGALGIFAQPPAQAQSAPAREAPHERDQRMAWWRWGRFGLFVHWGLYAIPAGHWQGRTDHGEWIRHSAQIPIDEYEQFVGQFNPVKFDACEWVRIARDAGMKYIVITSKHHDGFCLWDSQQTDFDVMSTPVKRDIFKELAAACREEGIRLCFYHSIMDWHHPDYLPRRPWEQAQRPAGGANFNRYVQYMKAQLRELVTNYGPVGVLWFDGEWEDTWNHERGVDLYNYVRSLDPCIIINNRVDKGRAGMAGMTVGDYVGDFGTPEQEIPATGLPGVDWETCMTMNDHWGYNRADKNFKSTRELVRMLCDIASKGGNLLLNVGPTAEGEFPPESVERLREIGEWMKVNGEAIHGTQASPFAPVPWGRVTVACRPTRIIDCTLYLHVFDWPEDGRLTLRGLYTVGPPQPRLLGGEELSAERVEDAWVVRLPPTPPDSPVPVIALEILAGWQVFNPPSIDADSPIFVDTLDVVLRPSQRLHDAEIRWTTDDGRSTAAAPTRETPLRLTDTTTITARMYYKGEPVSAPASATFTKVAPRPANAVERLEPGLFYEYFEGDFDTLPDFASLTPTKAGTIANLSLDPRQRQERFALRYSGYLTVPREGVYTFWLASDDGSRLTIGDTVVVDNDGLHALVEKRGQIPLAAGAHPVIVTFFQKTGEVALTLEYAGPGIERRRVSGDALRSARRAGPAERPADD